MSECKDAGACHVHGKVITDIASVSAKVKVLMGLVVVGLVIVSVCVTMAVGASTDARDVRGIVDVQEARREQQMKNIEDAVMRIDRRCERMEELLRKGL